MIIPEAGYTGSSNKNDFEWISSNQNPRIKNVGYLFTGFIRKPTVQTKYFGYFSDLIGAGEPPPNFDSRFLITTPTRRFWAGGVDITKELKEIPMGSPLGANVLIGAYNLGNYTYESGVIPSFIHEVCHPLRDQLNKKYNFYQSFYPYGNAQSPWGHLFTNTTIFADFQMKGDPPEINPNLPKKLADSDYFSAINQVSPSLTSTEYHQLFGINAIPCARGFGCNVSAPTQINYPYYECPSDKTQSPQFAEAEIRWTPGMIYLDKDSGIFHAKIGGGFYNNNPIPSFFDSHFYVASPDFCLPQSRLTNVYNNISCPAYLFERGFGGMKGSNGLLPDYVASALAGFGPLGLGGNGQGGYVDGLGAGVQAINENFWFWYFIYRENAENFPFEADNPDIEGQTTKSKTTTINHPDGSVTERTVTSTRGGIPSVQILNPKIANSDWYWKHRNCPEYPSALPWSFGGAIFAYPDSFFEVPYYSSIGKFGFYGTRFLNGKGTLLTEENISPSFTGCSEENNPLLYYQGGNNSYSTYDKLLKIAKNQELYSNFYMGNQGLMIAINYDIITGSPDWNHKHSGSERLAFFEVEGVKAAYQACYDFYAKKLNYAGGHPSGFKGFWLDLNRVPSTSELMSLGQDGYSFSNINDIDSLSGLSYLEDDILSNSLYEENLGPYERLNEKFLGENAKQFSNAVRLEITGSGLQAGTYKLDKNFYSGLKDRQLNVLRARGYASNLIDNPIDLFPLNKITYSYEDSSLFTGDKSGNISKGVLINGFNSTFKNVPTINRRYFYGAYANQGDSSAASPTSVASIIPNEFKNHPEDGAGGLYPKNPFLAEESFKPDYLVKPFPISGWVGLIGNSFSDSNLFNIQEGNLGGKAAAYLLGYNGVGKLKGKYSCFSPIFVQQPTDIICKIGQAPQLRCLAVDYHTIPEDKIKNGRWPEINYWVDKLKLNSNTFYEDDLFEGSSISSINEGKKDELFSGYNFSKKKFLYPLGYKWGRIKKNDLSEVNRFSLGELSGVEWSNSTGNWCCAEGDKETCTIIHPFECVPPLTGSTINLTPGEAYPNMEFIQGVKKESWTNHLGQTQPADDEFYYFCLTSGRFGMRRSEKSRLIIDNSLKFDISVKNPSPSNFTPTLQFVGRGQQAVDVPAKNQITNFFGFQPNDLAVKEEIIADRRTPNALGCLPSWKPCCSTPKLRTLGTNGYSSFNVTWSPPAVLDLPALNSIYGYPLPFGGLVSFEKTLTQQEGEILYGTYPLPQASNGDYIGNYKGVTITLSLGDGLWVEHWSAREPGWATDNTSFGGIPFKAGDIVSALYPPSEGGSRWRKYPIETKDQSYGKGHWQYSNNLGLIRPTDYKYFKGLADEKSQQKKLYNKSGRPYFSLASNTKDVPKLWQNIATSTRNYPGKGCGYFSSSLGRHMAYFIEGFDSFYLLCGNKKKEFVKNLSFAAAGLRVGNAGFQYSFLGQPNSSYLTRQSLYGPYAYMWKFNRHNRDRNGNGMPLGMYSYATDGPYSMMYDLPAVYGLYSFDASKAKTKNHNRKKINTIKDIKRIIWEEDKAFPIKFEFNSNDDEHGTQWCGVPNGSSSWRCNGDTPATGQDGQPYNGTPVWFCKYTSYATELANSPDLSIYTCNDEQLSKGACFHPCLSLRYDQGILPGGKNLDFFGVGSNPPNANSSSKELNIGKSPKQPDKISSNANYYFDKDANGKMVLGPVLTPWANSLRGLVSQDKYKNYLSIDPQYGGGCDHCNYITPTAWLGTAQKVYGNTNHFKRLIDVFMM